MGHEIVYCSECQVRLSGTDFEKGKAFHIHDSSVCADCAKKLLPTLPPEERERIIAGSARSASSARLPVPPGASKPGSTARMKMAPPRPPSQRMTRPIEKVEEPGEDEEPEEAPSPKRKIALIAGIGGGALLLVVVLVLALSGKKEPGGAAEDPVKPAPPLKPGEAALKRAQDFCGSNPADFDGQVRAWEEAVRQAQGTPRHEEARKELAALAARQKDVIENQWIAFESELRGPLEREEFKAALDACERSAPLFNARAWKDRVGVRIKEVRERPAALFQQVKEKAAEAKGRGDADELGRLRERLGRWGVGNFLADFDSEFAMAPPAPPPAPAPAPGPEAPAPAPKPALPPAAAAYRERWEKAMRHASARDFTAAASEIVNASRAVDDADLRQEAAADLEAANLLDAALGEALKLLAKWPAGQKLALAFLDEGGNPRRFEGAVFQARPHQVVLRTEEETVVVEFGEVSGASLAEVFAARADRKPDADARLAAFLCLLDGDAEAAKKYVPGPGPAVHEKYWEFARGLAEERARTDTEAAKKEAEARKAFCEAAREIAVPGKTWAGLQKVNGLLADFAETAFVRRNKASLAARKEAGKEYYFLPSDLVPSGTFKTGLSPKGTDALIAGDDLVAKTNYVEFEFSALPGTEYRCWVLMGGCCRENFTFYQQATELTMPDPKNSRQILQAEPDANCAQLVKVSVQNLKPSHAAHGGKKEPTRFEWVPLPLPKYGSPGTKAVRLLAEVKGAAIARVLVTSLRKELPKDAELKELGKARSDEAALGLGGKRPTGKILREWWSGFGGTSVNDLRGRLNQKPSGSDLLEVFDAPVEWANDYGTRIRGYVHPPRTGQYVFWIASDDNSELWLSTDEDPANKKLIGSVPEWTGHNEWGKVPSQKSEPVKLEAGRRYYIEALQKEGGGGDHLSVGWQLPGGAQERPIPGARLSDK